METLFRRTFAGSWKHFTALLLYRRWRAARIRLRFGDSRPIPLRLLCAGGYASRCRSNGDAFKRGWIQSYPRLRVYVRYAVGCRVCAPSASAETTGKDDDTWALSALDIAPPDSGTVSNGVKDTPSAGYVTITLNSVFGLRAYEEVTFAAVAGMTDTNCTFPLHSRCISMALTIASTDIKLWKEGK